MSEIMLEDWRTIQLFLEKDGVVEVELNYKDSMQMRCTCKKLGKCAHIKYVAKVMDENDGTYSLSVPDTIDEEEALAAVLDAKAFRDFVIKYGRVEVL